MAVVVSGLWEQAADAGLPRGPKRPEAAGPAAGGTPAARLEREPYNRTLEEKRVEFYDCRCGCRTCPKCGPAKGWRVRNRLLDRADRFVHPLLLTLTVDRELFESPEAAHERVTRDGLIRRLMARLGLSVWVWVLEFQGKTGLGWPHWHVLVDASRLPQRRIDLDLAWRLWRDEWRIGGLDLQRKRRFNSPAHAVLYVTKYLTKFPKTGFPVWVLESRRRIRFFQPCRKLGALVAPEAGDEPAAPDAPEPDQAGASPAPAEAVPALEPDHGADTAANLEDLDERDHVPGRHAGAEGGPKRRRPMRPLIDRMAECGTAANAILVRPDGETGTTTREWLGTVDANWSRLSYLVRSGQLLSPVDVIRVTQEFGDGGSLTEWRPFVLGEFRQDLKEGLKRLQDELVTKGECQRRLEKIAARRLELLERNVFAQREAAEKAAPGRDAEGGAA